MSTDLPPEAYTKDTLQKAFDWLQEQPEPVKASIHTPERLVSLYRKSQRLNDVDAPVSSKKFITDLKNLATSLNEFEDGTPQVLTPPPIPKPEPKEAMESVMRYNPTPSPSPTPSPAAKIKETKKASFEVTTESQFSQSAEDLLDSLSLEKVEKVRARFNLSSQSEALRLIISLGFEKFTDFQ